MRFKYCVAQDRPYSKIILSSISASIEVEEWVNPFEIGTGAKCFIIFYAKGNFCLL